MDNNTEVSIKFKNSVTGQKKLEQYAATLKQVHSFLGAIDTNKSKEIDKNTRTTTNNSSKLAKNFNTAFEVGKIALFANQLKRLVQTSTQLIKKSAEYTENLNLLSVAFYEQGKDIEDTTNEAKKYINTLSEMYGLDESGLTRITGLFKQMANSLGITNEAGTKLSQTLTQLSIDAASLFNAEEIGDAAKVFQSALASQTKPVRGFTGADITQQTLQVTLDTYGIDRAITDLSYAEKRLVIVASLVDQLEQATGDFGRTIESPANQMKIFTEQVHRLGRAIGNVLMPVFAAILPYINAFVMVLVELTQMLANFVASLFGYDFESYQPFVGFDDSVIDLEEDMNGATEAAKKLKSGLRGFDKLNVISSPSAGGAGGGGGTSGVDSKIYDLLNQAVDKYNSKLDKTTMLASKIRDRIMEWLGFTKQVDEETGKVSFKFEKITGGTVLGALATGGVIYSGIKGIAKILSKLGITSLFSKIGKGIKFVWDAVRVLGAKDGIAYVFLSMKDAILKAFPFLGKLGTAISGLVTSIASATGLTAGWVVAIGVAVVAAIGLIIAYWDEISAFLSEVGAKFNEYIIQPIVEFFTNLAQWIWDNVIQPIIDFFAPIVEAITSIYTLIIQHLTDIVVGVGKTILEIIKKVGEIFLKIVEILVALGKAAYDYVIKPIFDYIGKIFKWIYDKAIKPIIDTFANVGKWVYDKIIKPVWDKVVWLKDKAVGIFKSIGTTVVDFIGGSIKSVLNGIFIGIENSINFFIKMLNKAIDVINLIPDVDIKKIDLLKLPRLKVGMDFVPSDRFPAYLDYGERVLTRQENEDYNRGIIRGENAVSGSPVNATFVIQVGSETIATKVLNDLQEMAKSNGQPIQIGA